MVAWGTGLNKAGSVLALILCVARCLKPFCVPGSCLKLMVASWYEVGGKKRIPCAFLEVISQALIISLEERRRKLLLLLLFPPLPHQRHSRMEANWNKETIGTSTKLFWFNQPGLPVFHQVCLLRASETGDSSGSDNSISFIYSKKWDNVSLLEA